MKINKKFVLSIILAIIVLIGATVFASSNFRFESLFAVSQGYKERAQKSGISDIQDINILRQVNKDTKNKIKDINDMLGYVKDKDLKESAKYEEKKLMTYEDMLNNYEEFDFDPTISKDRMIWLTKIHYPNGYEFVKGFVKNAIVIQYYDAETGESLGFSIKSLDKDGNGIRK